MCKISHLLDRDPFDLSGGETLRAALAVVLAQSPDILLLDEPTNGTDAAFKSYLAKLLSELLSHGVSVFAVSHDVEFCAEHADRCGQTRHSRRPCRRNRSRRFFCHRVDFECRRFSRFQKKELSEYLQR